MADFNLQSLRTRTFKGFIQFQSPQSSGTGNDTYYRMKERQSCRINFRFMYADHYSDTGQKALDPAGYAHDFVLDLKTTADMFASTYSTSAPSAGNMDWQTLSYWIAKADDNDPLEIVFVATLEALSGPAGSTGEKYIHMKFVLLPDTFGPITYGQGGSNNITISGSVLSINYIKRSSSATPT